MEKTSTSSGRGGARQGSGRKTMGPDLKKVTVGFSLRPELKDRLFRVAEERGISASELIAQLIESL